MASLQEIIKAKGDERLDRKTKKIDEFRERSEVIRDHIIEVFGKRVGKALSVMKTIKENDPLLWKKICPEAFVGCFLTERTKNKYYFYSDGFYHTLGFSRKLDCIKNEGGGACGRDDFIVTETDCHFNMEGEGESGLSSSWTRECAKRFDESFEEFETRFKNFVDSQYGEGTYDSYKY